MIEKWSTVHFHTNLSIIDFVVRRCPITLWGAAGMRDERVEETLYSDSRDVRHVMSSIESRDAMNGRVFYSINDSSFHIFISISSTCVCEGWDNAARRWSRSCSYSDAIHPSHTSLCVLGHAARRPWRRDLAPGEPATLCRTPGVPAPDGGGGSCGRLSALAWCEVTTTNDLLMLRVVATTTCVESGDRGAS